MRHILTDYARKHRAAKRGGGAIAFVLDDQIAISGEQCSMLADLDDALVELAAIQPAREADIGMRFFGGLSEDQIAECSVPPLAP
jgi:hypothetical protein